ncbi:MAG: glycosyltransferase family 61 protein [Rhodobacteraceae bacterium]|nr:glycosyltransferase family 61 protein [Paracoccaceae bacterium]
MTTPPDLSLGNEPIIRNIKNGIVVPIPSDNDGIQPLNCGVLTADLQHVEESITWRDGRTFTLPPRIPEPAEIEQRNGRYMFAGLLFGHFGHFLVESTARLWAYQRLEKEIDGIVFIPKVQRQTEHVLNVYKPFLKMLDIEAEVINQPEPAQFDEVLVPQQGFGMFGMIEGLPEYRAFMRARMGVHIADDRARKLYVSRSQLPQQRGGLVAEELIEQHLEAEGYEVIHPQKMKFADQLAAYKSADFIISADGSPLHMAALVAKPTAKIAVIARRPDVAAQFELQFRAFCDIETVTINALKQHWIPNNQARPSRMSYGELDFTKVYHKLKEGGLINGNTPWPAMTDAERESLMADLEERQKIGFKLYAPPA